MALLPGIALPPCSLGQCSATKIRYLLAVGHVRTSQLVYDPSSHLSCGILWFSYSHLTNSWLTPYCHLSESSPADSTIQVITVLVRPPLRLHPPLRVLLHAFQGKVTVFALLPLGFLLFCGAFEGFSSWFLSSLL